MEKATDVLRRFVAAPKADYWARYTVMHPGQRHAYEIIREGEPCNIYFGRIVRWHMCVLGWDGWPAK